METNGQKQTKGLAKRNLTTFSDPSSSKEISVYSGQVAETELIKNQMKKVRAAFPSLPKEFYVVLHERVLSKEITAERLIDSVNNVIDTCHYPTPTIADFISYDKKIKLLTYYDVCGMANEWGSKVWDDYKPVDVPGTTQTLWANKKQIEIYHLKEKKSNNKN